MLTRTDAIAFIIRTLADNEIIRKPTELEILSQALFLGLEPYDYRQAREIEQVIDNVCAKVKSFRTNRKFNKIVEDFNQV